MSNQVTIKRTSTFISDFDAIQRKFNRLNAKIQAVEDRQKAINDRNISTYNGKAEVCKKKRFGELQGTKVISARSPDTRYNYTVDEIKQQETDFTVHQQIFTKKKLDSNFKPISENKTFGKIKVTGFVTQEKMFRQISEVVTLAKKEDCFEIPGGAKFTTMRDGSGREITGDELEKMLSEFGASASSFISNKTEAVEAAQVKFEEIPLHYTKRFTSDYGDISIRGGYSTYSGTVTSVEEESGIVLGNATVLQNATIGPRSVITKDLIVDEARQIQVVNQSTRGIGGKALDLGIAYHADITDNFSIGASISSKYILDSSDKFIEENSFLDTTLALGVGIHNFEKSFSVNMEYEYNVEDQLKPKSHGFLASMIYNF